ncbi:MAG: hypothetical protein JWL87_625 [Candidatus Adlerbacteria bacterium]|nr:hypothetical protein [Candidatus Adlerbacteria bacterium]
MAIDYKASSEASRQALVQAGLTPSQSAVYEALIHYGPQKATRLAFLAGVPRTLSYKMLEELQELGLVVKKDEAGRVSLFTPAHPFKLKELAERRLEDARSAKQLVEEVLPALVRNFDSMLGSLPEAELYAQVAMYAGRAGLGDLSAQERLLMQKALTDLLETLQK